MAAENRPNYSGVAVMENAEHDSDESEEQTSVIAQPIVAVNVEEIESTAEEISEAITMEAIQEANQYNQEITRENGVSDQNHSNEGSDYEDIK